MQVAPGIYRHYKGNLYRVIDHCLHTETEEEMVLYYRDGEPNRKFVRPAEMFVETVEIAGAPEPRFRLIERAAPEGDINE